MINDQEGAPGLFVRGTCRGAYSSIEFANRLPTDLSGADLVLEALDILAQDRWEQCTTVVSGFLAVSADQRLQRSDTVRTDIRRGDLRAFDVVVPQVEDRVEGDTWFIVAADDRIRPRLRAGHYRLHLSISANNFPRVELPYFELVLSNDDAGGVPKQVNRLTPLAWTPVPRIVGPGLNRGAHEIAANCSGGVWSVIAEDMSVLDLDGEAYPTTPREAAFLKALHELARPATGKAIRHLTSRQFGTLKVADVFRPTSPLRGTVVVSRARDLWDLSPHGHKSAPRD